MQTDNDNFQINEPEKYSEGGFFNISDALDMITYSQDKSLVMQSYKKLCDKIGKNPDV
jgi:hypothetical protein